MHKAQETRIVVKIKVPNGCFEKCQSLVINLRRKRGLRALAKAPKFDTKSPLGIPKCGALAVSPSPHFY